MLQTASHAQQTRFCDQDQRCSDTRTKTGFQVNTRSIRSFEWLNTSSNVCFIGDLIVLDKTRQIILSNDLRSMLPTMLPVPCSAYTHVRGSLPVTEYPLGTTSQRIDLAARKSTHPPDRYGSHWDPVNIVPGLWRRKFNSPCRFKSDRGAAKSEIDAVPAPALTASSSERHSRSLFRRGQSFL